MLQNPALPPPPTLLFMGRIFQVRWGGVRDMAESLLASLAPIAFLQGRRIEVLVPEPGITPVKHEAIREVVLPRFGGNRILWDHITVPLYANAQKNAVLYNIKLVLPEGLRIPGFTSIHDLMYYPQPKKYDWREYLLGDSIYMQVMVRRTVRRANLIHVDSEYTAQDARELFPEVPGTRFRVIHLGIDRARWAPGPWTEADRKAWQELTAKGVRGAYVFYSGGLSRRKNVPTILEAFATFREGFPDWRLVMTGADGPTNGDPGIAPRLAALPKDSVVRLGWVTPRQLALLYQRAAFSLYPSLYEGFGMPPLESQAADCPVICSNATSLPEVVGSSAPMVDPRRPDALAEVMARLAEDPDERDRLIELGRLNLSRFSWETMAAQFLALADEVFEASARAMKR